MRDKSLAVFTLLSQMAVGLVWTMGLAGVQQAAQLNISASIFSLSALGLLAAFFHLGKPLRGWRALANFRSSWLSREILFAVLFSGISLIFLGLHWLEGGKADVQRSFFWILGFLGLALVYSMARAYQLRTVPAWDSLFTLASFFVTSCLLGILMAIVLLPDVLSLVGIWPPLFLAAQLGLSLLWVKKMSDGISAARLSAEKMIMRYKAVFGLRIGLGVLGWMSLVTIFIGWAEISEIFVFVVVLLSELLGRLLFYTSRVRVGV